MLGKVLERNWVIYVCFTVPNTMNIQSRIFDFDQKVVCVASRRYLDIFWSLHGTEESPQCAAPNSSYIRTIIYVYENGFGERDAR